MDLYGLYIYWNSLTLSFRRAQVQMMNGVQSGWYSIQWKGHLVLSANFDKESLQ